MAVPAPVSSSFRAPYETQLVIKLESWFGPQHFSIKDGYGKLMFELKTEAAFFTRTKRRIYDAATGNVVLLLMEDMPCCGFASWLAFRGDSESESDLRFTLMRNYSFGSSTSFLVFHLENNDSSNPDFTIKRKSWLSSSFTILYKGTPIAEATSSGWATSAYNVTVYQGVDQAFVGALVIIWILERMKQNRRNSAAATTRATN